MSSNSSKPVIIYLLGKEYQIACTEEKLPELKSAASYLDKQMRSIRDSGKVIGLERIAIMAALNLCHELLNDQNHQKNGSDEHHQRLEKINEKLDSTLNRFKQIEL